MQKLKEQTLINSSANYNSKLLSSPIKHIETIGTISKDSIGINRNVG